MKTQKQCIGIDVSKDSLECCIGSFDEEQNESFSKTKSFKNTQEGFEQMFQWVNDSRLCRNVVFTMEATGVYYENLAYWLFGRGEQICVLLPGKIKHFTKSHNVKTKTDSVDAKILSRIGLERKMPLWTVPTKMMRDIKFLCRELREVKEKIVHSKNQLHAKNHSYDCPQAVIQRLSRQISLLEGQLLEIEAELRVAAMADRAFYDKVLKLQTIPGLSFITIICILAETNAFALVLNAKQLASYAGLDVQLNQSGSKSGKTKISKKGNSFIRNALYMPALSASRYNPLMKSFYNRVSENKPSKKIAITAIARKLLILMYVMWKNNTEFNVNYNEVGRPKDLPTQDEVHIDESNEILLSSAQIS
ncbi:MAG TPA: IS110 family transposase [Ignavibacteriaceae bacterium]